jgi:hypothetical protein
MSQFIILFDAQCSEELDNSIRPLLSSCDCKYLPFSADTLPTFVTQTRVLLWLCDEDLARILPHAAQQGWQVGFIPHPQMNRAYRSFYIPKEAKEAIADILGVESAVPVDLMFCNRELVLSSVMLGNPDTMRPAAQMDEGLWSKLINLFSFTRSISQDSLFPYRLVTAKNTSVNTAAIGITVVYRASSSEFTSHVFGETQTDEPTLFGFVAFHCQNHGARQGLGTATIRRHHATAHIEHFGSTREAEAVLQAEQKETRCSWFAALAKVVHP